MHCPYCQAPVSEESPACPRCGVNMDKATAFFGTPPRLSPGVNDSAGVLTAADTRAIRRSIRDFEQRFPQSGFSVAFLALGKDMPGGTYAWWVFNRSLPAGESSPAAASRQLFLLVDTVSRGAWLTQGYGLEPFVGVPQLQQCLDKARPYFVRGEYAVGIAALLNEAEAVFSAVIASLPRIFGLPHSPHGLNPEPAAA